MNHSTLIRPLSVLVALALLAGCNKEVPIPKDPPEARKDYARTALDTPVTLAPLANDYDADDPVLTVAAIGAAAHGTAVLNGDGTVTYTPNLGYLGPDSFTVTVRDGHNNEVTETAYITVGDSSRFVYVSNYVDYYTRQLYLSDSAHPGVSIPLSARFPVTEGPTFHGQGLPVSGITSQFVQNADGTALVYLADDSSTATVFNFFFVDLSRPGVATKLTDFQPGQSASLVIAPVLTPDNRYAFYLSNEFNPATFELVRVEIDAPQNKVRMNPAVGSYIDNSTTPPTERWGIIGQFRLSPDGSKILYLELDQNAVSPGVAARVLRVVDVDTPGVAPVVSGTPTSGAAAAGVSSTFEFVGDTGDAIYVAYEGGSSLADLYVVDIEALTPPVKMSGTAVDVGVTSAKVSPDLSRVVYISSEATVGTRELYTATFAAPGLSTRLSEPRTDTTALGNYQIGHDSTFVVYQSDEDTSAISELYKVDFANPTVQTKLNHVLRATGAVATHERVLQVQLSAAAPRHVIYTTNDAPVPGEPTQQTARIVSVDAPGTGTAVAPTNSAQYLVLWSHDGENLTLFDDPDSLEVISAFRGKVSDPSFRVKLTNEQFPGSLTEVSLTFPFLP